jgi:hypothetical protein
MPPFANLAQSSKVSELIQIGWRRETFAEVSRKSTDVTQTHVPHDISPDGNSKLSPVCVA